MPRERRGWGAGRTLLWMGGAFAAGCIPSGRLLTRALTGKALEDIGDGKPGSSNVARNVGWKSGAAVLALDAGKAYVPATAARLTGAGYGAVADIGISAMLGHIAVVKGRGAACALGAMLAMDPGTMAIGGAELLGGAKLHRNPQAVAVTAVSLPLISLALHRRPFRALGTLVLISILLAARIKGSPGAGWPSSPAVLWRRFWLDRDD
ncbi:MAG: glycerol-3-phosphate acyltransferase [Actinobacteria bacterium]|nr:glycerol-3-phosphate acyltransferase [Actinomycetota bacterium]